MRAVITERGALFEGGSTKTPHCLKGEVDRRFPAE